MKLALGTVQFGLSYGVSNQLGQPSKKEIDAILNLAKSHDIALLDTAFGYGESHKQLREQNVGSRNFDVITKLPPLNKPEFDATDVEKYLCMINSIFTELAMPVVWGVLFHHAEDLFKQNNLPIINKLYELKSEGKIKRLGASIYSDTDLNKVLENFDLDIIQLPFNLIDTFFAKNGWLNKLDMLGVEVHARSLFLQGLLLMEQAQLPDYFRPWLTTLQAVEDTARKLNVSKLVLCLAYMHQQTCISKWVIGVNAYAELAQIIDAYEVAKHLARNELPDLSCPDLQLTNPSLWKV